MKKGLAYIASPYRAIQEARPDLSPQTIAAIAKNIAQLAARYVRHEMGYIPVSPILTFDGVFNELSADADMDERRQALAACIDLMEPCGVVVWVDTPYTHLSTGMQGEKEKAEAEHKRIEEIPFMIGE